MVRDHQHLQHTRGSVCPYDYRPDVDGLRAIAVSAVIAHHFWSDLLPSGFLGVDMFFVISGYVITASLAKQPHNSARDLFLGFYARRVKRILPALVVCVVITCLVGSLFIDPGVSEYARSVKAGVYSLFGLSNMYFYRESTDYFGAAAPLNLFTHTWSLGVEEQFYVIFPALFWLSGSASRRPNGRRYLLGALSLATIVSFALFIWLDEAISAGAYFLMPPRFWELSIGCMIAIASPHLRPPPDRNCIAWATWLAFVILVIALLAPVDRQLYAAPAAVIGTAVLIMTLRPRDSLYRLLTLRSVLLIGLMSYSLYLWHWSVLSLSRWTVGVHWWTAPVQLCAMLGLAAASYVFVERPLRRAEWSTSKFRTIGYGLVAVACAAGAIIVLKKGYMGDLYTGTPPQMAARGVETLMDSKWLAGNLEWRPRDCILSSNEEVGKQIDAERCTLKTAQTSVHRQFLVIGNSFSAAEFEMYSVLSEKGLGAVIATSSWGASPVPEIPNNSPWAKANAYYWSTVVPSLTSHLGNGDFLIMINDLSDFTPSELNRKTKEGLALLRNGLHRLAKDMRQKGVQIIFQSQNPLMREAQCTPQMAKPQWFTVTGHTSCVYYSKSDSIRRIRPLHEVLQDVQSLNSNFHILDLFPVLCAEGVCRYYDRHGVFLYRDVWSHPSIEANYIVRPTLLSVVNDGIGTNN